MTQVPVPLALLVGLLVMSTMSMVTMFFVGRLTKRGIKGRRGEILFIGHRPSTDTVFLRLGRPLRGVYTWKEPGDFTADILFDKGMVRNPPAPRGGATTDEAEGPRQIRVAEKYRRGLPPVVEIDLDVYQAISYDGYCRNDDTATVIYHGGKSEDIPLAEADDYEEKNEVKKVIREIWRRLPGTRQNAIRKATDIAKMNEPGSDWIQFGLKALPFFMVFMILLLFGVIGALIAIGAGAG